MHIKSGLLKSTAAAIAVSGCIATISMGNADAAILTVEYDVSIQQFTDYAANTTSAYTVPIRHGSVSFLLGTPTTYVTTIPFVAADPGPATMSFFGSSQSITFRSPVSDLIDSTAILNRLGPAFTEVKATNFQRASDNLGDQLSARLSAGTYAGLVSSSYLQSLYLSAAWTDAAVTGPAPYVVTSNMLVDYLLQAWTSKQNLNFSESFSVYDVLKLRYVEGVGYSGTGEITGLLIDGVSLRTTVPEPSTFWLSTLGLLIVLSTTATSGAPRRAVN